VPAYSQGTHDLAIEKALIRLGTLVVLGGTRRVLEASPWIIGGYGVIPPGKTVPGYAPNRRLRSTYERNARRKSTLRKAGQYASQK
jgi:hypothetical protein